MRLGLLISTLLHGTVLFGGLFLFSRSAEPLETGLIIPIELVSVADVTNIRAAVKAPDPEDIPVSDNPMRLANPLEAAPEADAPQDSANEPAPPESIAVAEATRPDDVAEIEPVPTPDKKPEKPKPAFDLEAMSALIDRARDSQPEKNQQKTLQSEDNLYEFAKKAREGSGLQTGLTVNEIDALRSKMYSCWRVSLDAKNPEDLLVRVRVQLHFDGQVKSVSLLDKARITASSDPYLKIAAERAVRAVSKCAPYDFLPQEKYSTWKDMELSFRPEV